MKLLITGSRNATLAMLDKARAIVGMAYTAPTITQIIVGDADGIDAAVIEECDRIGMNVMVWGAHGKSRRRSRIGTNIFISGDYLARDRIMVERCDKCHGVWNGQSRGTAYTFNYAMRMGKHTLVYRYRGDRLVELIEKPAGGHIHRTMMEGALL